MRILTFWTPLLLAGGILSINAIGRGVPAKVFHPGWDSAILAACANNRRQCTSISIQDGTSGMWNVKVIHVGVQPGKEDAGVALIDGKITGIQRHLVHISASSENKGKQK